MSTHQQKSGAPVQSSERHYGQILGLIESGMRLVDDCVQEQLRSEVALVEQVARYIIQGGGKRIRPGLVLLADGALSPDQALHPEAVRLATVVEFIHTATLLHDDVVDESALRRNRQTANALFGNAASVLVGDFLYSRAFELMVQVGSLPVMKVLAEATNIIAEGEVLQLMNCQDPDVDEARYLQVIRYKTAKLFEAACALPAIIRGEPQPIIDGLAAYGRHLGTAFQITDDLLDYAGQAEAMGKQVGDDLREGKPTLPLIHLLQNGRPEERAMVRSAIESPESTDVPKVLAMVQASGALDYTREAAQREAGLAAQALQPLMDSPHKASLLDLASFVLQRQA